MKEILDVYNNHFELIGKTIERGQKGLKKNEYIMLAIVFVKNNEGKYLIQKTSKDKANTFSTTGGHVLHKETPEEAIVREVEEELSLKIEHQQFKLIDRIILKDKPCIFNVYILEGNFNIQEMKIQEEEVESVYWLDKNQIINLIEEENFLQSHGKIFKLINNIN